MSCNCWRIFRNFIMVVRWTAQNPYGFTITRTSKTVKVSILITKWSHIFNFEGNIKAMISWFWILSNAWQLLTSRCIKVRLQWNKPVFLFYENQRNHVLIWFWGFCWCLKQKIIVVTKLSIFSPKWYVVVSKGNLEGFTLVWAVQRQNAEP